MSRRTALVLIGHGSHISPNTAGVVWGYVDRLRATGAADEITACFWKEQPSIHEVIDTLAADEITVIPVFTAQGFFTQSVIPAEMELQGETTVRNGRTIRYGKTPGEHPNLAGIMRQRVEDKLRDSDLEPSQTTVAVVGHGTKRNKESRAATRQQVQLLSEMQLVHDVIDGYLDDEPSIPSVYSRCQTPNLIVVPFFLAPGSHVTIDVPNALGLPEGETQAVLNGKSVYYTDPIGTEDTLCQMILDLAFEAGLPEPTNTTSGDLWSGCPSVGQSYLEERIQAEREIVVGELLITANSVRSIKATDADGSVQLRNLTDVRGHVRQNPFRPLSSSTVLPGHWMFPISNSCEAAAVVETVYPGVLATMVQAAESNLVITRLEETIDRQVGNFKKLEMLSPMDIEQNVRAVCGKCIKHPLWFDDQKETNVEAIPCAEACNYWLSLALEKLS